MTSIVRNTSYPNYSILVINNETDDEASLAYLSQLGSEGVKVLDFPYRFNFAAICNYAVSEIATPYVCFVNNDVEVMDEKWLDKLMSHAIVEKNGIVGASLFYPSKAIQHLGIAMGVGGVASHIGRGKYIEELEDERLSNECRAVSAVTFAVACFKKSKYTDFNGMDEEFRVGMSDVDLCLKLLDEGFDNVFCSHARLIHGESQSRKSMFHPIGAWVALKETINFIRKWPSWKNDQYFF